jgi:hypothetical protein
MGINSAAGPLHKKLITYFTPVLGVFYAFYLEISIEPGKLTGFISDLFFKVYDRIYVPGY